MNTCELASQAFVEIAGKLEDPLGVLNEVAQASRVTGRDLLNETPGTVFPNKIINLAARSSASGPLAGVAGYGAEEMLIHTRAANQDDINMIMEKEV